MTVLSSISQSLLVHSVENKHAEISIVENKHAEVMEIEQNLCGLR